MENKENKRILWYNRNIERPGGNGLQSGSSKAGLSRALADSWRGSQPQEKMQQQGLSAQGRV
jgi:hypothetical protein